MTTFRKHYLDLLSKVFTENEVKKVFPLIEERLEKDYPDMKAHMDHDVESFGGLVNLIWWDCISPVALEYIEKNSPNAQWKKQLFIMKRVQ